MRSLQEIRHRLRQELVNVKLLIHPPKYSGQFVRSTVAILPDPSAVAARLKATAFADEIKALADNILQHRFPIFDSVLETGTQIEWRRDYRNQLATGTAYFRRIPYLDAKRVGDHKWIWELNRHQHLVVLAQAFLFFREQRYLNEIEREVSDWHIQNPFQRSINWASALEVAFRAMSWLWVIHLVGSSLSPHLTQRLEHGLFLHGHHLENNLSFYFSPNTHLLGEAVALHAIGVLLPHLPASSRWMEKGSSVVRKQMETQVQEDGSHFEQSTYYHVYALDMFLTHAVLSQPEDWYCARLKRMADFLQALLAQDCCLPFFGDDDGGRWFHPYGKRSAFGNATLAACNAYFHENSWTCIESDSWSQACWWMEDSIKKWRGSPEVENQSLHFPDSGLFVLQAENCKIVVDFGLFGRGSAGHSHADTLSLTISAQGRDFLVDPGTFTYVGNPLERNHFRGTAAHNTIRIDSLDQADPVNPFRWANPPSVQILRWESNHQEDILEAECAYRGFTHRRFIQFVKPYAVLIVDSVFGPPGDHSVEQFWHLGSEEAANCFRFSAVPEHLSGWRSQCYGQREPSPVFRVAQQGSLPLFIPAAIQLGGDTEITISINQDSITFTIEKSENQKIIVNYLTTLR